MKEEDYNYMKKAMYEAEKSLFHNGIPIGAVLVKNGKILGKGHNRLLQDISVILHAEMDCFENAGRLRGSDYRECTLYTTLSPCEMCSGTILLYKIPRVVIGENTTLKGPEEYLMDSGVEIVNLDLDECKELIGNFIEENPEIWAEEIERIHK